MSAVIDDYDDYPREAVGVSEWRKRWPNHCPACRGWGMGPPIYQTHEPGYTETLAGEPCYALPIETCHRCGAKGLTEDGDGPCSACGWDYDDGEE